MTQRWSPALEHTRHHWLQVHSVKCQGAIKCLVQTLWSLKCVGSVTSLHNFQSSQSRRNFPEGRCCANISNHSSVNFLLRHYIPPHRLAEAAGANRGCPSGGGRVALWTSCQFNTGPHRKTHNHTLTPTVHLEFPIPLRFMFLYCGVQGCFEAHTTMWRPPGGGTLIKQIFKCSYICLFMSV